MCQKSTLSYSTITNTVVISQGNPNLDGSGNITVLVVGSDDGAMISTISIKALQSTSQGMIRFFLFHPSVSGYHLYAESYVPETTQTGVVQSFSSSFADGLYIPAGSLIGVATQNSESFSITAQVISWTNCSCD
jgi:hypothetical protein